MIATLLTAFRTARSEAISKARADLASRNSPKNSEQKRNREMREVITSTGSRTDIVVELWEKVDSEHIVLTADVAVGKVGEDNLEDLMK